MRRFTASSATDRPARGKKVKTKSIPTHPVSYFHLGPLPSPPNIRKPGQAHRLGNRSNLTHGRKMPNLVSTNALSGRFLLPTRPLADYGKDPDVTCPPPKTRRTNTIAQQMAMTVTICHLILFSTSRHHECASCPAPPHRPGSKFRRESFDETDGCPIGNQLTPLRWLAARRDA